MCSLLHIDVFAWCVRLACISSSLRCLMRSIWIDHPCGDSKCKDALLLPDESHASVHGTCSVHSTCTRTCVTYTKQLDLVGAARFTLEDVRTSNNFADMIVLLARPICFPGRLSSQCSSFGPVFLLERWFVLSTSGIASRKPRIPFGRQEWWTVTA